MPPVSLWYSIEVFDGATSASVWAEAYRDILIETAITQGATDWSWHRHPWGVVFEVLFPTEQQWQAFNARVTEMFAKFNVRQFHLVDLRHNDKDFAGWSTDRRIEFVDELQHIANETLEAGVTAFLSEENYQKHYCALDWPRRARKDTKYCILFRACMAITPSGF